MAVALKFVLCRIVCVVLVDLYLAKMNDITAILASFVICTDYVNCASRLVRCKNERQYCDFGKICDLQSCALRAVLAKIEGCLSEFASFWSCAKLAWTGRP